MHYKIEAVLSNQKKIPILWALLRDHQKYMKRCLELAVLSRGYAHPNPLVGALILYKGKIISESWHKKYGAAHAEVNAIQALQNFDDWKNTTLYVNLEPCSHFGKTPPCANFIIEKGIGKVVIGALDPNLLVAGNGAKRLKENGIEVITEILKQDCQELNEQFYYYHQKNKPFILLKWAQTLNGYMGKESYENQEEKAISNWYSQKQVHQLRAKYQAILIGANTLKADNPQLTVRRCFGKNPIPMVFTTELLKNNYDLLNREDVIIFSTIAQNHLQNKKVIVAENLINALIDYCKEENILSVMVEGGSQVLQSFIDANEWNKMFVIQSSEIWENGIESPRICGQLAQKYSIKNDLIIETVNQ